MRRVTLLFVVCLAVLSSSVLVAQNTKQLFQPIVVSDSANLPRAGGVGFLPGVSSWQPGSTTADDAVSYQTTSVFLSCPVGATAWVSGDNGTGRNVGHSLIVDNYIQVQTNLLDPNTIQNIPLDRSALYSGQNVYPYIGPYLGKPVDWSNNGAILAAYQAVADQPVALLTGDAVYTFNLMDWGYTYGNSAVWLKTSCTVNDKVCHKDNGAKGDKTLTRDPNGYVAHLANHQYDTPGACADGH